MEVFEITQSLCPTCRKLVPARVEFEDDAIFMRKFCTDHGESRAMIRRNVDEYLRTLRYVKPAQIPDSFAGDETKPCPEGCGSCSRHEQHLCMPIIEITSRCNMSCPICIANAGAPWDMALEEFSKILDSLLAAERQVDVLNLSGGEPLLHPDLLAIVDQALSRDEIVRVSISTNGRCLLDDADLLKSLTERNVVVSLQFDGFDDDAYQTLRGEPLADEKRRILDLLQAADAAASLTMTLAGGVNEAQLDEAVNCLMERDHLLSLMIQPLAFAGRGEAMSDSAQRLGIPDVVSLLGKTSNPAIKSEDFVPLPCSHPLCFSLAFYLRLDDGGIASIAEMLDAPNLLDAIANRTVFGLDEQEFDRLREMIYEMWSGPVGAAPDGQAVMSTLSGIMRELSCNTGCFDPRRAFGQAERRIKSIFIHAFQDAETFDLARVRRCCNAYPQADGKLIPACVHNVMGRKTGDTL